MTWIGADDKVGLICIRWFWYYPFCRCRPVLYRLVSPLLVDHG